MIFFIMSEFNPYIYQEADIDYDLTLVTMEE